MASTCCGYKEKKSKKYSWRSYAKGKKKRWVCARCGTWKPWSKTECKLCHAGWDCKEDMIEVVSTGTLDSEREECGQIQMHGAEMREHEERTRHVRSHDKTCAWAFQTNSHN